MDPFLSLDFLVRVLFSLLFFGVTAAFFDGEGALEVFLGDFTVFSFLGDLAAFLVVSFAAAAFFFLVAFLSLLAWNGTKSKAII